MPDASADALVVGFTGHPYNPDPAHGPAWYPRTHDTLLGSWGYFSHAVLDESGYAQRLIWILARYMNTAVTPDPDPFSFYIADLSTGLELADVDKPNVEAIMVRVQYDGVGHGIGYDYTAAAQAEFVSSTLTIPAIETFEPSVTIGFADYGRFGNGFTELTESPMTAAYKASDGTFTTGAVSVDLFGIQPAGVAGTINMQHGKACGWTAAYQPGGIYSDYLLDLPAACPTDALYGWGTLMGSGSGEW